MAKVKAKSGTAVAELTDTVNTPTSNFPPKPVKKARKPRSDKGVKRGAYGKRR